MIKNHQSIRSRCLVHEFSITDIFNDINHRYRTAMVKKDSLWLLPFYMVVATYFYYEKVRRTMRTATVSYLLDLFISLSELKTFLYLRRAYTMKFFFHDLEIIISKEKCGNISGREMCVMKYYSELRYAEKVSFKERLCSFNFVMIRKY